MIEPPDVNEQVATSITQPPNTEDNNKGSISANANIQMSNRTKQRACMKETMN